MEHCKGARLDAVLQNDEGAVDVVEVVTEADKTAVEGQILSRQRASAVGDSVGRAEIARTPDKNAAQAAQRVVGATVVGNRFVFVRGLGERYTNALLNGAPCRARTDRAAVPLDLFPTITLDSLTIAKTFTPDVPGDFAGGSVRVETRRIPSKFIFQSSLSGSYNSQSTFRDRLSYKGGSTDWLGFDDGFRALPRISVLQAHHQGRPNPAAATSRTKTWTARAGRQLVLQQQAGVHPPDHSLSVAVGNAWKLGRESRLGALVALELRSQLPDPYR
ncbi:MAG: TonB-dependent receptor plug domain-containing protein [Myxococcales bacterium]|nr:TonB-dependent receptor plug domain-containing protein [Myxococcales bacterium]